MSRLVQSRTVSELLQWLIDCKIDNVTVKLISEHFYSIPILQNATKGKSSREISK